MGSVPARKLRLESMDFVRTIALLSVMTVHYNAEVSNAFQLPTKILTNYVFGLYLGVFGVSLFFILSGAALMYTSQRKISLKSFYAKRFKAIYPTFWCAFVPIFLFLFYFNGGIYGDVPKVRIILTVFGLDGYLGTMGYLLPNYAVIGDWFVGCIVCLYAVFPFVHFCVVRKPLLSALVAGTLLIAFGARFNYILFFLRIPEMMAGMYYIMYRDTIKKHKLAELIAALACMAVLILTSLVAIKVPLIYQFVVTGSAAFFFFNYAYEQLSRFPKAYKLCNSLCKTCSKYSFEAFLVHHILIWVLVRRFDLKILSNSRNNLMLFLLFLLLTAVLSYFLKLSTKKLLDKAAALRESLNA